MADDPSTKSYFQRPENLVNIAVLGGLGYGGVVLADKILPTLVSVAENTLYLGVLGVGLTGLGLLVVNKDLHKMGAVLWKSGIRWITNKIITIDPIGILKDTLVEVYAKIKEITKSEASLREQIRSLEAAIDSGDKEAEANWKQMAAAKKAAKAGNKSMGRTAILAGRQAGRVKESNATLNQLLAKLRKFLDVTVRMREGAEFAAEDMKSTIDVKERERKAIRSAHRALNLASRIIKGDREMEMYNLTLEHLNNDYFEKLGQIEQFMNDSQTALDTMDLQNMVFEEDAFKSLEEWEHKADAVGRSKVRVDDGSDEQELFEQQEAEAQGGTVKRQSYADLYDLKK